MIGGMRILSQLLQDKIIKEVPSKNDADLFNPILDTITVAITEHSKINLIHRYFSFHLLA